MEQPRTRYARSGSVSVAYQVLGDGPKDLVFAGGWVSHLESGWDEPLLARFRRRLASFSQIGTDAVQLVAESDDPTGGAISIEVRVVNG